MTFCNISKLLSQFGHKFVGLLLCSLDFVIDALNCLTFEIVHACGKFVHGRIRIIFLCRAYDSWYKKDLSHLVSNRIKLFLLADAIIL